MTDVKITQIPELIIPGKRLGRHIEHDPRSRDFAYEADIPIDQLVSVEHVRHGDIFKQEQGSCTGMAAAGACNTDPLHSEPIPQPLLVQDDAVEIYEQATELDHIKGTYPPIDTGSTGLAAAKACDQLGYITSYKHAFSIDAALAALQKYPIITGVPWYESFDNPDSNGLVEIDGEVRGGHEFEVSGFQRESAITDSLIVCINSWGLVWGEEGIFYMTVGTWRTLLEDSGDATILLRD